MNTKMYSGEDLERDMEAKYGPLTFARILYSWRECEEMSQKDLAKKLKVTPSTIADLESGRRIPSPKRAAKIALALGALPQSWIELALQDLVRRDGFPYSVSLKAS